MRYVHQDIVNINFLHCILSWVSPLHGRIPLRFRLLDEALDILMRRPSRPSLIYQPKSGPSILQNRVHHGSSKWSNNSYQKMYMQRTAGLTCYAVSKFFTEMLLLWWDYTNMM